MKNKLSQLVTLEDIDLFFTGWKFSDWFIYVGSLLVAFILGIIAKGYYQ